MLRRQPGRRTRTHGRDLPLQPHGTPLARRLQPLRPAADDPGRLAARLPRRDLRHGQRAGDERPRRQIADRGPPGRTSLVSGRQRDDTVSRPILNGLSRLIRVIRIDAGHPTDTDIPKFCSETKRLTKRSLDARREGGTPRALSEARTTWPPSNARSAQHRKERSYPRDLSASPQLLEIPASRFDQIPPGSPP